MPTAAKLAHVRDRWGVLFSLPIWVLLMGTTFCTICKLNLEVSMWPWQASNFFAINMKVEVQLDWLNIMKSSLEPSMWGKKKPEKKSKLWELAKVQIQGPTCFACIRFGLDFEQIENKVSLLHGDICYRNQKPQYRHVPDSQDDWMPTLHIHCLRLWPRPTCSI